MEIFLIAVHGFMSQKIVKILLSPGERCRAARQFPAGTHPHESALFVVPALRPGRPRNSRVKSSFVCFKRVSLF